MSELRPYQQAASDQQRAKITINAWKANTLRKWPDAVFSMYKPDGNQVAYQDATRQRIVSRFKPSAQVTK